MFLSEFLTTRCGVAAVACRERRKFKRFSLELPAKVEVIGKKREKQILDVRTSNVSAAGAFFLSDKRLTKGVQVRVDLVVSLNNSTGFNGSRQANIKVEGTVLRSSSAGMAISFHRSYQIVPQKGSQMTFSFRTGSGSARQDASGSR